MNYDISFNTDFRRNPYPGKFIVIEGIDGSGKTTQAKRLVGYLRKKGMQCIYTKEPTDEIIGKLIRRVLTGKTAVSPVAFQYLFAADRAVHQVQLEKYLKEGVTVVSDRYFWSSVAYGMVDRGVSFKNKEGNGERLLTALSILSMYHRFILPDYSFYLRVLVETALARISNKKKSLEVYERKEKLAQIKMGYDWLAKKFGREITVIDGEKEVEEVAKEIGKPLKLTM